MNFTIGTIAIIAINGFSMVLLPLKHHHWMLFSLIDHWHRWFFNGFPQILVRWSTMVLARLKDLKKLAIAKYPIFWQMHLMIEKGDKWIPQIISEFPGHFADWRQIKTVWTFRTTICYHCKVSMVFKGTITIEWNGLGQPLGSMVFQWFWSQATIGFDGFRWLSTIGPTMEWLHTIVEV